MSLTTPAPHFGDCNAAALTQMIPYMRAFARSLCRDATAAEDLTQEALASAWAHRDRFLAGTNLKAWVFTILRNQFYSDRRRDWRLTQLDSEYAAETLPAVTCPDAPLELDDVRRAMARLPDDQREALTLIGVAGMSYSEVASICGCAEGTIKSRVCRARARMIDLLGGVRGPSQRSSHAMIAMQLDATRLRALAA